jgi:hypothetical protein
MPMTRHNRTGRSPASCRLGPRIRPVTTQLVGAGGYDRDSGRNGHCWANSSCHGAALVWACSAAKRGVPSWLEAFRSARHPTRTRLMGGRGQHVLQVRLSRTLAAWSLGADARVRPRREVRRPGPAGRGRREQGTAIAVRAPRVLLDRLDTEQLATCNDGSPGQRRPGPILTGRSP